MLYDVQKICAQQLVSFFIRLSSIYDQQNVYYELIKAIHVDALVRRIDNQYFIKLTTGLLQLLKYNVIMLVCILAHEFAHIALGHFEDNDQE